MEPVPTTNPSKEERIWATIVHLSAFSMYFTGIGYLLGPLVVWLLKREGHPFLDDQGKEALNFQITITIIAAVAVLLCFTIIGMVIGIPVLCGLHLYQVICMIIAAVKANEGIAFRYPFTLRFVK